jgi:hypothetical protein
VPIANASAATASPKNNKKNLPPGGVFLHVTSVDIPKRSAHRDGACPKNKIAKKKKSEK